ncbi:B-cell receptor-associated protein 31-like-domain-containing protein [Mrakia frigida]|uniref:B-cell receptor-associated protein 31-like-domain-containing protein n=1 Tax=Mrakia frigida TaxID=29902 RepID=UPI003FCC1839
MTLYYSLCFLLLAFEIGLSGVVLAPWPHVLKRKIFHFLNENPIVAKVQYALKITFLFVALLFVDAVQRLVRVTQEKSQQAAGGVATNPQGEAAYHGRKFYAQRNMYLTGGTLGLALLLARSFSIALELIEATDELGALKKGSASAARSKSDIEELEKKIDLLQAEVKKKDTDLITLKSQASNQAKEFDRIGSAGVGAGVGSNKKVD